ncbi:MAG TPA: CPBP family intramembrane glutamic endopeptidase [Polyangia bacterium]
MTPERGWLLKVTVALLVFKLGHMGWLIFALAPSTSADEPQSWVRIVLFVCLLGPILEELVFRGWLLRRCEPRLGRAWSILVTAALFSALHLQLEGVPPRFVFGVVAAVVVYATGALDKAILLHIVNNIFWVALSWWGDDVPLPHGAPGALALGLLLMGVGLATLIRLCKPYWPARSPALPPSNWS